MWQSIIIIIIKGLWAFLTKESVASLKSQLAAQQAREDSIIDGKEEENASVEERIEIREDIENQGSDSDVFGANEFNQ